MREILFGAAALAAFAISSSAQAQETAAECGVSKTIVCIETEGGTRVFNVELVDTERTRAQGLMNRESLPADAGMLFDFRADREVSMWMKDTLIPLDMAFIARDGTIVTIAENAVPHSTASISSGKRVRAVLEVNGGALRASGVRVGDAARHPIFQGAGD